MWKNLRLRLRGWVALAFELVLPPLFTLILVLIRNIVIVTVEEPAYNVSVNGSLAPRPVLALEDFYQPPSSVLGTFFFFLCVFVCLFYGLFVCLVPRASISFLIRLKFVLFQKV